MNNNYHLNETQNRIYDYIIKKLKAHHKPTITEVADQTFVSTTYIVKMTKQLGYSGYSDFLHVTYWILNNNNIQDDLVIRFDDGQKEGVEVMAQLIVKHALDKVFLIGTGYSDLISLYCTKRFSEIGIFCYHGSPLDMKMNIDNNLVIFISRSGETDDLLNIAKKISTKHDRVLITSIAQCSLAQIVDVVHIVPNEHHGHSLPIPNLFVSKGIAFFELVYQRVREIIYE